MHEAREDLTMSTKISCCSEGRKGRGLQGPKRRKGEQGDISFTLKKGLSGTGRIEKSSTEAI